MHVPFIFFFVLILTKTQTYLKHPTGLETFLPLPLDALRGITRMSPQQQAWYERFEDRQQGEVGLH